MFEEEAKELVSKFGVDNPENTMGYIFVLSALEQAYKKGVAAQHGLHQTACAECGQALYHKENCSAINHPLAIAAGKANR